MVGCQWRVLMGEWWIRIARGVKVSRVQIQSVVGVESHFVARYSLSLLKHMVGMPLCGVVSVNEGGVVGVGGHTGGVAATYVRSFEASICSCHIVPWGATIVAVC